MKWGISIKKLRNEMKLSQADFARELGVSSSSIGRWEKGKSEPNAKARSVLTKLCNQYAIPYRDEEDLFSDCLRRLEQEPLILRAFTDRSYNSYLLKNKLPQVPYNSESATYGDAVLKLAFCDILWEVKHLTQEKQKYESDKNLVEVIGKRYDIIKCLKVDRDNPSMPKDYVWCGQKDQSHKRIATCLEALIGAIFMIDRDIEEIIEIARFWKGITDEALTQKNRKE